MFLFATVFCVLVGIKCNWRLSFPRKYMYMYEHCYLCFWSSCWFWLRSVNATINAYVCMCVRMCVWTNLPAQPHTYHAVHFAHENISSCGSNCAYWSFRIFLDRHGLPELNGTQSKYCKVAHSLATPTAFDPSRQALTIPTSASTFAFALWATKHKQGAKTFHSHTNIHVYL